MGYSPWSHKEWHDWVIRHTHTHPGGTVVNNPSANSVDAKDIHSVLRFGISLGVGNDNLLSFTILSWKIPWRVEPGGLEWVHGARKSRKWLSTVVVIQSLSYFRLVVTPWTSACQASLSSITISLSFPQTHVHWLSDAIQSSHPLLSPFPAFSLSQHQGIFQGVSSSYQVAKVLELQPQHQLS